MGQRGLSQGSVRAKDQGAGEISDRNVHRVLERTKFAVLQMSLLWKQSPERRAAAAEVSSFNIKSTWPRLGHSVGSKRSRRLAFLNPFL